MSLTKVTSGAITDSAITTAKIEDGTIVNADINASANIAQSKLSLTLPTISSISIEDSQGAIPPSDTSLYFDIIGTNFSNPSTVELLDSSTNASTNATTVTYVSATQLRVTASLSAGTYKIRVTRSDGFAGISATALLTVSQAVSWSTSAGSLGTFDEGVAISTITLSATSNSSITYAIQSGSLPTGLSLNTSNGEITGTPSAVAADTTSTFTVRATDVESQYADREFTITVTDIVIFQSLRFNDDDSANLSRTPSSATNRKTWTWSGWVKLGNISTVRNLFSSSSVNQLRFNSDNSFFVYMNDSTVLQTNAVYRDTASWYHIIIACDTTQSTASNRTKLYVNGTQITSFATENQLAQDTDTGFNNTTAHTIGRQSGGGFYFDGYMAEVHFIDGQALTPSSFGTTGSNGRWKPKTYSGTYGTNGFYLDFADSGNLGDDESGNTNDFTATNLAATDQTTDTPQNNFATMNPLLLRTASSPTFSEGNCKVVQSASNGLAFSSISVSSGKWYVEVKVDVVGSLTACGIIEPSIYDDGNPDTQSITYQNSGNKKNLTTVTSYGASYTTGDIIGIAFDADNGTLSFYKNGASQGTAFTGLDTTTDWIIGCLGYNGTASNNYGNPHFSISSGNSDDNGYGNFEYAPPTGFLALCTNNLPEPTIKDSGDYFNTVLYTGNNVDDRSITGVGFQPDFMWSKERTSTGNHVLVDSSRGATKVLQGNLTNGEATVADGFQAFESDGFQVGAANSTNETGVDYVNWCWLINGGTETTNNDGTIESYVQTNTTSGISIAEYQGNGSNGATFGHGLGSVPDLSIYKCREQTTDWAVWPRAHNPTATNAARLNSNAAFGGSNGAGFFNDVAPTSSVITLGTRNEVNQSSQNYVSYHFKSIPGFSKFGVYTGNGSAAGPFLYFGFKPQFIIIKRVDAIGSWFLIDVVRDIDVLGAANTQGSADSQHRQLFGDAVDVESTYNSTAGDFLSNGYKLRATNASTNASGGTYIYIAFAEAPFGGILTNEATAR